MADKQPLTTVNDIPYASSIRLEGYKQENALSGLSGQNFQAEIVMSTDLTQIPK